MHFFNSTALNAFTDQEKQKQAKVDIKSVVAASILMKVHDDAQLREQVLEKESEKIVSGALATLERVKRHVIHAFVLKVAIVCARARSGSGNLDPTKISVGVC